MCQNWDECNDLQEFLCCTQQKPEVWVPGLSKITGVSAEIKMKCFCVKIAQRHTTENKDANHRNDAKHSQCPGDAFFAQGVEISEM